MSRALEGPLSNGSIPHWEVRGPAAAPPIVFVHGALMTRSMWYPQVEVLSTRYRCISVDLPGHGTLAERAFSLEEAVDAVVNTIDEAAGGRAVVVGLSLGGYVAMALAGRHPERVRGLILAGSSREPVGVSRLFFEAYGWAIRLAPEPAVRAVAFAMFRRRYGAILAAAITAGGHFARGGSHAVRQIVGSRFGDRLVAYGGPVLLINGDLDLVFRIGAGRFLAGVPGVGRATISGAGHLSNVDRPAEFTNLVQSFVESLAP